MKVMRSPSIYQTLIIDERTSVTKTKAFLSIQLYGYINFLVAQDSKCAGYFCEKQQIVEVYKNN